MKITKILALLLALCTLAFVSLPYVAPSLFMYSYDPITNTEVIGNEFIYTLYQKQGWIFLIMVVISLPLIYKGRRNWAQTLEKVKEISKKLD